MFCPITSSSTTSVLRSRSSPCSPSPSTRVLKNLHHQDSCWRTVQHGGQKRSNDQVSLPQLKDLSWRVDLVTGSDSVSRMSVPTCLVQLKMEDPCPSAGGESVSTVTVELSRESLDTILDGLGRIRDQLSVVAGK
uniref:COMM domain containing 9 n=1 Tax=Amphiprion percula TaxID=161767 RepID=A0A3P8RVB8_AMPPE